LRQLPNSYQVTLDGLGKAAATQRWQVNPRGDMREWSQPPPTRVLCADRTPPSAENDSECGNVTRGAVAPLVVLPCCS
jgi:hypothetical protein